MRMFTMKSLLVLMWPLVLAAGMNAQDNARSPQRAAIRTPEGAHFIWNQLNNNFTLDIRGKDVRPNNRTDDVYFRADDITVQIQTSAISQFISGPKANRPDEHTILTLHRDWETQHAETILGK